MSFSCYCQRAITSSDQMFRIASTTLPGPYSNCRIDGKDWGGPSCAAEKLPSSPPPKRFKALVHLCCGLNVKCASQVPVSDHLVPASGAVLGGWVLLGGGALQEEVSYQRMALRLTSQALLPDCRGNIIT